MNVKDYREIFAEKFFAIGLFMLLTCTAYGQEVNKSVQTDTLKLGVEPVGAAISGSESNVLPKENITENPLSATPEQPNEKASETTMRIPVISAWNGGFLTGYNSYVGSTFAYGNIAGMSAFQQFGDFSVEGSLDLSKINADRIGIVNGISGNLMLNYTLNRNLSLHAFGGIGNLGFMGPAPNQTVGYYGGYLTMLTNNQKWGMDVGVRRVYNSATGRWETIPIAMPYYNLGGAKLGFDLGGLLYGIFWNATNNSGKNHGSNGYDPRRGPAIIAPPIDTAPHFERIETPKSVEKQYGGNQF